jgi:hypothetical protein
MIYDQSGVFCLLLLLLLLCLFLTYLKMNFYNPCQLINNGQLKKQLPKALVNLLLVVYFKLL